MKIMASKPFSAIPTVLIVVILFLFAQSTVAQYSRRRASVESSWEFGFSGGASRFLTSINPNSDAPYKKFNYWNADYNGAITLSVIKNFNPKFSAEFEFLTTKLSGVWNKDNAYGFPLPSTMENPPGPFKTGLKQFNLLLVANLNQIVTPKRASDRWYLFVKAGGGGAFIKEYSGLFPYNEGGSLKYSIAYGGGISYTINEKIKIKLGSMWYRIESDRLDGIHTTKPGIDKLTGDANFYYNLKERYIYPYIGMTYAIGELKSKSHFSRGGSNLWFKPSKRKYKR